MPDKTVKALIRLICCVIPNKTTRKKKRAQLWENFLKRKFFADFNNKTDKQTFFCIGDSHTDVFSENTYQEKVPLAKDKFDSIFTANIHSAPKFATFHLDGVLAYSLNRRDTTNKGVEKIEWLIKHGLLPKGCKVVTIFGEPDCRAHVKKQAERQGRPTEDIVEDVIKNYGEFLIKMKNMGYKIYVWQPVASQKGNMEFDPVFKRYTSEIERNQILKIFETKMKDFCKKHEVTFVSILSDLLNEDMTSKGEYYLPDGVHLNMLGRELIMKAFAKLGEE